MKDDLDAGLGLFTDQVVFERVLDARAAKTAPLNRPVHPRVQQCLHDSQILELYEHQALAYEAWSDGKDFTVITGTSSGKSLCYSLPILQTCASEPLAKSLVLFPTKALAYDQTEKLKKLGTPLGIKVATYDGDTASSTRPSVRRQSDVIVTNPDMLHLAILPGHENWAKFFKSLRLIVIDEVHSYRGVFGSHLAAVLRRLLRICEWHHSRPQIICCSATIGNPQELVETLTGRPTQIIDQDGSPRGRRTLVFLNPPKINEQTRLSGNIASSEAMANLVESGVRTLTFNRSRVGTELVLRYTRDRLSEVPKDKVESYRAGYTAKDRRKIEQSLHSGALLGLSTTNALELGIDIGSLDAVVLNGYPGSISAFWQQVGRAGRGIRDGLALFIPHDNPLDQHMVNHPELLLEASNERVLINPDNPKILEQQLLCAAHEKPIAPSEASRFGNFAFDVLEGLDRKGLLVFRNGLFYYPSVEPPAFKVSLRGATSETVRLIIDGEELGSLEMNRALMFAHPGAVYLHRGDPYLVELLSLEQGIAQIAAFTGSYYTQPVVQSTIDASNQAIRLEQGNNRSYSLCHCMVTDTVVGYRKKALEGDSVFDVVELELPPQRFETVAVRIDLSSPELDQEPTAFIGAIHGLEHILTALAPAFLSCDRNDLGSAWYQVYQETLAPALFIFDRIPGGIGLAEGVYSNLNPILIAAEQRLSQCECQDGCPGCLFSYGCEIGNEYLDKRATINLIRLILRDSKGIV